VATPIFLTLDEIGKYLHGTLAEMAASYLFHIARNHPFVDGNKRTALMTTLIFLGLNGRSLKVGDDELTDLVLGVAKGEVELHRIAHTLESLAQRIP